jgi:hypothetical protein
MDSYRFFRRYLGQVWRRRLTGRYVSVGRPVGRSVAVGQTFNEEAGGRRGEQRGEGVAGGGGGGGIKGGCMAGRAYAALAIATGVYQCPWGCFKNYTPVDWGKMYRLSH